MRLSKTSAQAALAAAFLCQQEGSRPVQARHVADHLGIPTDSALKILQALTRAGVLSSRLGRNGGYRLDRDAREISLLQIVEAIDGPISGVVPLSRPDSDRGHLATPTQLLHEVCDRAARRLRHELTTLTVADLASRRRRARRRDPHASGSGSADPSSDDVTPGVTPLAPSLTR